MVHVPVERIINTPEAVKRASDKLRCLRRLEANEVGSIQYTTHRHEAEQWSRDGEVVYCRELTRASQGRGITVAHSPDELVSAPLYTKGVRDVKREYRAHVLNGEVIDLVAKATRAGEEPLNSEIRNHSNGWVFVRDAVTIPDSTKRDLVSLSISAVEALDLDMGAVDIIRDERDNLYVLEINTAPGVEGTTLEIYQRELNNWMQSQCA
jgi:glutathione synthase/RimK-type ligase-like ATP-grasp enzyme